MDTGIYVRVSTEEQAQEGFSIRAQNEKLQDFARIKDYLVYKSYIDEGISGKTIKDRPALNELIEDIKQGRVKNVLVYKIDRLTRNTSDLIFLIELFNKYECTFNSLMESIDTLTASGRMFIKIIGIFAEFERENIIERARLGFERKAREGYSLCTRTASFGYDRKNGRKIQQINEYEAHIVRDVFNMFVNKHLSFSEIAHTLNNRNIPTKESSKWHARSIKNLLTNCNYVGRVRYASKDKKRHFEAEGVHKPIIAKELYAQAQELILKISIKSYTKRPKEENYFSGVLFCAKCGGRMVTHGSYRKAKDGSYLGSDSYRCRNYILKTCTASYVSQVNVEKAFQEYIRRIEDLNIVNEVQMMEFEAAAHQNQKVIKTLQSQNKKLDHKEKEIVNLYVNGHIDLESYLGIKKFIGFEKSRLSSELGTLIKTENEKPIVHNTISKNIRDNWVLLDNLEKRQFLICFIEKIFVENKKVNSRYGIAKITGIEFCELS